MQNWHSNQEIAKDGEAFDRFMHALLGLYIWEFITSLSFDWEYVTCQRKLKWPMIFYFAGRYFLLFALIGIAISLNVTVPVNCQALYTYNQIFGNATIGLASINLSLRTMAVWSQAWYIVFPLVAVIFGQWSLLLHGILLKAEWIPGQGCVITSTDNKVLAATFIYTMCFDFTVLTLAAVKLGVALTPRNERSRIMRLIFHDGLIFFIVAFVSNVIATTFMLLNLNAVMSIIANVPAAVASTIVACRVVRRLTKYTTDSSSEFFSETRVSTLVFTRDGRFMGGKLSASENLNLKKVEGVHARMKKFEAKPRAVSPSDSFVQYTTSVNSVELGQRVERRDADTLAEAEVHSASGRTPAASNFVA